MDIMEIILLIAGGVIFVLSFFIPDKNRAAAGGLSQEDVRAIIDRELEALRKSLDEAAEESVVGAMEKTERSLEKLSNEKIMAVNEYSDTVLSEIHKSHEEVMFMYDMLNNKHASLKNTAAEVNRVVREAGEAMEALRRQMEAGDAKDDEQALLLSADVEKAMAEAGTAKEQEEKQAAAAEMAEDVAADSEYGSNKERIRSLYRQGKSVADIARELELGVGEVKLVIDLFQG